VGISAWRGRGLHQVLSTLVTCALLFVLLGINVSILGLIAWSGDGVGVLMEFFGLIAVLLYGYGAIFVLILGRIRAPAGR